MDKEKIGGLISALRKEKGMTQKELADQLHVSDRTVSKWERGAGLPDPSIMIALADILGITVNELLVGERAPEGSKTSEDGEAVKEALQVLVQHVKAREKSLRKRILAGILATVVLIGCGVLAIKKLGEDRILFPPDITCEILKRDAEVEMAFLVGRASTGNTYNYVCGYESDCHGNVSLTDWKLWQSHQDAVHKEVYESLRESCPGEVLEITKIDTGYLAVSYPNLTTVVITEIDWELCPVFRYTITDGNIFCTAFTQNERLYLVTYDDEEGRTYITSVDKVTGEEETDSFIYQDFDPEADDRKDTMGNFMFNGANMWVKNGVLYFVETRFGGPLAIQGAYDLKKDRVTHFEAIPDAHVIVTRKEPEMGQVAVLINPGDYRPLELHLLDDETMETLSITKMELPAEFLTHRDSEYAAQSYYLFDGDMDETWAAVFFGDVIGREQIESEIRSEILVIYDRETGTPVWRGRFQLDEKYEIDNVRLLPE